MTFKDHRNLKTKPAHRPERVGAACAPWTVLLPDAAEGLLTETEQKALEQHLASCMACSEELAEAQRGLAWLTVLKEQPPEPPEAMLANILAKTTGLAEAGISLPAFVYHPETELVAVSAWQEAGHTLWSWLRGDAGTWSSLLQPRLAMTGAMAFFSICLTVNLLGFSVTQLDAQTFTKGGLHRTVADKSASLVRSFEGLRVVYRVQSRVNEMRAGMDEPAKASGNW